MADVPDRPPLPPDRAHALARILAHAVVKAIQQEDDLRRAAGTADTASLTSAGEGGPHESSTASHPPTHLPRQRLL